MSDWERRLDRAGKLMRLPTREAREEALSSLDAIVRRAIQAERARLARRSRWVRLIPAGLRVRWRLLLLLLRLPFGTSPDAPQDDKMPGWAVEDLRALSKLEPPLAPTSEFLAGFVSDPTPHAPQVGERFRKVIRSLGRDQYDIVMVVPWLLRGGADKGVLQFLQVYSATKSVLLITTRPEDSLWLHRVPVRVEVLELKRFVEGLGPRQRREMLLRLLLQLAPEVMHVVNSDLGFQCITEFHRQLRARGTRIVISLFADGRARNGAATGYAVEYLPKIAPVVDAILTDNQPYRTILQQRQPEIADRIHTLHFWQQPLADGFVAPARTQSVLWAGRLCLEKRLDLLVDIARRMPDWTFHVYGAAEQDSRVRDWIHHLSGLKNLRLSGAYDSFESLLTEGPFARFLYTTASDGLPNVLLEAAAAGLPIVAPPSIGGLSDIVTAQSAFSVAEAGDPSHYVEALVASLDPELAASKARAARDLLLQNHTRERFQTQVQDLVLRPAALARSAPAAVD